MIREEFMREIQVQGNTQQALNEIQKAQLRNMVYSVCSNIMENDYIDDFFIVDSDCESEKRPRAFNTQMWAQKRWRRID